jgi:hypothetical protein
MPTPSETLHAIRGAANANSAALASVRAELPAWLAEVETWSATSNKGSLRDQLQRVNAAYEEARKQALRLAMLATHAIDQIGTGGDPDALPPAAPWSTGELQVAFGVQGRPTAGLELGRYLVVESIVWDPINTAAIAEAAATAQSDVLFSVLNGGPLAQFRFLPGELEATVTILGATSAPGDVLIATAPAVRDATLAGIAGTLVGQRIGP